MEGLGRVNPAPQTQVASIKPNALSRLLVDTCMSLFAHRVRHHFVRKSNLYRSS